jgi:hypothetical protein
MIKAHNSCLIEIPGKLGAVSGDHQDQPSDRAAHGCVFASNPGKATPAALSCSETALATKNLGVEEEDSVKRLILAAGRNIALGKLGEERFHLFRAGKL